MLTQEQLRKSQEDLISMEGKKPSEAVAMLLNTEPKESKPEGKQPEPAQSKPTSNPSRFKKGIDPKNPKSLETKRNKMLLSLRDSDYAKLQQIAQSLEVSLNEAVAISIDEYKIKKR